MPLLLTMGLGMGRERVAPTISNFIPEPRTPIASTQRLQFDVTDDKGLGAILVTASFPNTSVEEVVYRSATGTFGAQYAGSTATAISGGMRIALLRATGWPGIPTLNVDVVDTSGNLAS